MRKGRLERELRTVGASPSEAEKLADIAELLGNVKPHGLSSAAKKRIAPTAAAAKPRRTVHTWQWALAGSFATACVLVIVAQSALPGSWLYGLKRKTEEARALVQPGYKDDLIEKREEEVQQLMLEKADPAVLEEAEKEFQQSVENSLDRWRKQDKGSTKEETRERFTPRYDWSRQWYRSRGYTQDIMNDLDRRDNYRKDSGSSLFR